MRDHGRPATLLAAGVAAPAPDKAITHARLGRPPARDEILHAGRLAGLDPEDLARRFGTPFYVYDLDCVDRQVEKLRASIPPSFDLFYTVKANPALAVIAAHAQAGLGAVVGSAGELGAAIRAGSPPSRIVMVGPGKSDDELRGAVAAEICAVTVESTHEVKRLERTAASAGRRVRVLFRAAQDIAARLEWPPLVGDDGAGKFGMDRNDLRDAAQFALRSPHLEPLGLHTVSPTSVLDARAVAEQVRATIVSARRVAVEAGFPLQLIVVGGGLGIPYDPSDAPLDLARLAGRLNEFAVASREDPVTRRTQFILAPGRFLVAEAGAYVARVVDRKTVDGNHVIVLDGGINHLLRPALIGQEQRVRVVTGRGAARGASAQKAWPVTIAGPLCSGLDIFAASIVIPLPDIGDLVAVLDAGAYGYTQSMPFYLSRPAPAEVAVRNGHPELIRPRIGAEEWLDRQVLPAW